MSEVSCRAFAYFRAGERRGKLDLQALLAGLPMSRSELDDPNNRASWDLWAELCERTREQLNDDQLLVSSGEWALDHDEHGFTGFLGPVLSMFSSPAQLIELALRWAMPSLYRCLECSIVRQAPTKHRVTIRLRPGFRPSPAFFLMVTGGLSIVPALGGYPRAVVTLQDHSGTHVEAVIATQQSRTLQSLIGRGLTALRSSEAVLDELGYQQEQLIRTEELVRRAESGFRCAFDALPSMVAFHAGGRLFYTNPALSRVMGHDATRLGASVLALFWPADHARAEAWLAGEQTEPIQLRIAAEGRPISVEVAALPAFEFSGRLTRGLVAQDVSSQERMAETQKQLMSSLPDLAVRVSLSGVLLDVVGGRKLEEHGKILRELVGSCVWDLESTAPPPLIEPLRRLRIAMGAALEQAAEQRIELQRSDEEGAWFELRVVPRESGDEVLVLVRDISLRKQTERQLAISERLMSIGTLAAGVAHEINNPLTYIIANQGELAERVQTLRAGGQVDLDEMLEMLESVQEGTARVREIVAGLRTFSRIEPERRNGFIDPREACERALAMCAKELRLKAEVVQDLEEVPRVVGDTSRLVQVLVNLLLNAAQAVPNDGRDHQISVKCREDHGTIAIFVSDTGSGIDPSIANRIFDPFFTTKPPGQGTGLGLSISHQIVRDMGGELRLATDVIGGTRFVITLPAAVATEPRRKKTGTIPPAALPRVRVLIIDDDPAVARAIRGVLIRDGHEVVIATSGAQALSLMDPSFDLVLCDLMMPGFSGEQLYAQVQKSHPVMAERFAFVTGGAFGDDSEVLENAPCPVIAKPPERRVLRSLVEQALARRSRAVGGVYS